MVGFYDTRVLDILFESPSPLSAQNIWMIFKKKHENSMQFYKGLTKKQTVEACLYKLWTKEYIDRVVQHDRYAYFLSDSDKLVMHGLLALCMETTSE